MSSSPKEEPVLPKSDPSVNSSSSSSSSSSSKPHVRTIILRDTDGVMLFGAKTINWHLANQLTPLQALDAEEWNFTSMKVTDSQKSKTLDEDDEFYGLSRKELEDDLAEHRGMHPRGIITPADPVYGKGLGAAYRDFILSNDQILKKRDVAPIEEKAELDSKLRQDGKTFDAYVSDGLSHSDGVPSVSLLKGQQFEGFIDEGGHKGYIAIRETDIAESGKVKIEYAILGKYPESKPCVIQGSIEIDKALAKTIQTRAPIPLPVWVEIQNDIQKNYPGLAVDIASAWFDEEHMQSLHKHNFLTQVHSIRHGGLIKAVMADYFFAELEKEGLPEELNLMFIDDEIHHIAAVRIIIDFFRTKYPNCEINVRLIHYDKNKMDGELQNNPEPPISRKTGQARLDLIENPFEEAGTLKVDFLNLCHHLDSSALFKLAQIVCDGLGSKIKRDPVSAYYLALLAQSLAKTEGEKTAIADFIHAKNLMDLGEESECRSFYDIGILHPMRDAHSAQVLYERYRKENLFNSIANEIAMDATRPLHNTQTIFSLANERLVDGGDAVAAWMLFQIAIDLATSKEDKEAIKDFLGSINLQECPEGDTNFEIEGHLLSDIFRIFNLSQVERDCSEEKALLEEGGPVIQLIRITDAMYVRSACSRKIITPDNVEDGNLNVPVDNETAIRYLARVQRGLPIPLFLLATIALNGGEIFRISVPQDREAAYYLAKLAYIKVDDSAGTEEQKQADKEAILSFIVNNRLFADESAERVLLIGGKTPQSMYADAVRFLPKMGQSQALSIAIAEKRKQHFAMGEGKSGIEIEVEGKGKERAEKEISKETEELIEREIQEQEKEKPKEEVQKDTEENQPLTLETMSHFFDSAVNWMTAKENRRAAIAIGVGMGVSLLALGIGITIATLGVGPVVAAAIVAGVAIKSGLFAVIMAAVHHPIASISTVSAMGALGGGCMYFFGRKSSEKTASDVDLNRSCGCFYG